MFRRKKREDMSEDYTDVMGTNVQMPHCDQLILHSPGACEYCDRHPEWQQYRSAAGIAFSDMSSEDVETHGLVPCPSTYRRSAEIRDRWGGNVPKPNATLSSDDRLSFPGFTITNTNPACGRTACGIMGPHTHMG